MTASDEDPVSRGKNNKKKDGGKGNKKEEKKNKTEKKMSFIDRRGKLIGELAARIKNRV